MKTLLLFLLLATSALAAPVTLEWDHEQQAGERYILRAGDKTFPVTDAKQQTIELPAGVYSLTVSAINTQGVESAPSAPLAVTVPVAPGNLRVRVTVSVEINQ